MTVITVVKSLNKASQQFGTTTSAKASGLYNYLKNGKFVLGLKASFPIIKLMENLNKMLQSSTTTVGGMIEAVDVCIQSLNSLRNPDKFKEIFDLTEEFIESNDLDDIPVERQKNTQKN